MPLRLPSVVLFFCLCLAAPSLADTEADWASAKAAFAAGDYETALALFERARDAGLDGPAVHYNIAVAQFELERYGAARETFALISDRYPAMRGLAQYNLGLVSRRQGRSNQAAAHFLEAYEQSADDETIRILASQRLRELQPDATTASRWSGAFGLRAGNDDNVALRDEAGLPVGTTTESPMADLFASFSGPFTGTDGFRLEASAYLVRYVDADNFDQSELRAAGLYEWRPGDWRIRAGLHASAGTLAGDAFDRKLGVEGRVIRYLGTDSVLDARYTYDDVSEADEMFAAIAGNRQRVDLRYRRYRQNRVLQLRYQFETNDRQDAAISPERNRVAVEYRYEPEAGLGYEAGIDFRNSEYRDIAVPRDEDLLSLRAAVTWRFGNRWMLMLEMQRADNDSDDPAFAYERSQLLLGLMRLF